MKTIIAGRTFVLKSGIKMEDLKFMQTYDKDALILKNEKGEPEFAISAGNVGSVSKFGICFDLESNDPDKFACVSLAIPENVADVKEYVADVVGGIVAFAEEIENEFPDALATAKAARSNILESIEVLA